MSKPLTVAKVPCGSCPYRKDVPSGIWEKHEYDKLPEYDAPTPFQPTGVFMCHQKDGNICAGWLGCHGLGGPTGLLAMRLGYAKIDPEVINYKTDVPLFSSGKEARAHGIKDLNKPKAKARKMIDGLIRKRGG